MPDLLVTSASGLESVVAREIESLGYDSEILQSGRQLVMADEAAIARLNLNLRVAERVLVRVGTYQAHDFDALFEQARELPWETWIPADGRFPVRGRSVKSQLSSVPALQRAINRAVADRLLSAHEVDGLPETGAQYSIEVALLKDQVTLTIDTTGEGLHKRGYRPAAGKAPLRETLAAALVLLSRWSADRPLIDPFCGLGTIPIEAALIGRQIAPGINRRFAAEHWPTLGKRDDARAVWETARAAAKKGEQDQLPQRILGTDVDGRALHWARQHAIAAGVGQDIHFQQQPFEQLSSTRKHGCLICNPPYGMRIGEQHELAELYRSMPLVLRRLPTWSHYILTAYPDFEKVIGQRADRRRKLFNGRIECQFYQFFGPKPLDHRASGGSSRAATPVFGGLPAEASRQATEFRNRLIKRAKHLRKWPARGITCYRLYERDIPEVPLIVDRYEDWLHISEVARPHERTPASHADWLDLLMRTAADALDVDPEKVAIKKRRRQIRSEQYQRQSNRNAELVIREGGLKFIVNMTDYLDTGLFLDHRLTRGMVRSESDSRRVLNLFCYTGTFSVYSAAGGANSVVSVDASRSYLEWARRNFELNEIPSIRHRFVCADAMQYLRDLHRDVQFDLMVIDPPTYSNSKDRSCDWDVQRQHVDLLQRALTHLAPTGTIYFSTNFRRFKFELADREGLAIHEISRQTVPEDFRNRRIHRCWKMQRC